MGDAQVDVALDVGAEHAEGPAWDAPTGRLWWVDIIGEQVHCFDPATGENTSWPTDGQPGGVLIDVEGRAIVGLPGGLALLEPDGFHTPDATQIIVPVEDATQIVVPVETERPENRINDMKGDSSGRIWAGTMAYQRIPDNGALYRVEAGEVVTAIDGLTISNGPAIDESAGLLYVADTARMTVDVYEFDIDTGKLTRPRRFLDFTPEGYWPDGMTVDDEGCLWLALGRSGTVHRYTPDASLVGVIELPVTNPTSVAFGGTRGRPSTSPLRDMTFLKCSAPNSLWPAQFSPASPVSAERHPHV